MKICVPVNDSNELQSQISEHFGSAPYFAIVDSDTKKCQFIKNSNQHHNHGMCQPLSVISAYEYDFIVVGGIGAGALRKLNDAGKEVIKCAATDLKTLLDHVDSGKTEKVTIENACSSHNCED